MPTQVTDRFGNVSIIRDGRTVVLRVDDVHTAGGSFIWHVGQGSNRSLNRVVIRPGEFVFAAFDIASSKYMGRYPVGTLIDSIANVLTDSDDLGTAEPPDSIQGSQAVIAIDGTSAQDGADYVVTCDVTTEDGDVVAARGVVECRA